MPGRLPEEVSMDKIKTDADREREVAITRFKHELDILSGMPQLADFEQQAEIMARIERAELLKVGGRWYELVDFRPDEV